MTNEKKLFEAKLSEAKLLKQGMDAIAQLINECSIKLTKDGLELRAMDSANVSMVDYRLLCTAFESYKVEDTQTIGLVMGDFTQILKRARPNEPLELSLGDNRLEILIGEKRRFVIPLLDIGDSAAKSPNLEFKTIIEIKADALEEALADAEIVSDAMVFEADKDKFTLIATGDGRKVEISLDKDSPEIIGIECGEKARSMFPLEYLKKMIKGAKMTESTKLEIGNDYPLRVTSQIQDQARISFVLAPRIEND